MMKFFKQTIAVTTLLLASMNVFAAGNTPSSVANFSFKDVNGEQHQFSEYRGKWVIVNYWATYCGPCVSELPALNNIAKRFKSNTVVLGMEAGETPTDELKQFAAKHGLAYKVAPTQDSTMFAMGLIYGVPTTFIVNPKGQIVDSHMGAITAAQLQKYIQQDKSSVADKKDCKKDKNKNVC